jgi:hypothetical protein
MFVTGNGRGTVACRQPGADAVRWDMKKWSGNVFTNQILLYKLWTSIKFSLAFIMKSFYVVMNNSLFSYLYICCWRECGPDAFNRKRLRAEWSGAGEYFQNSKYKNIDCEHHFSFLLRSLWRVFVLWWVVVYMYIYS